MARSDRAQAAPAYTGICFDIVDETIIDRCCVERATEEEAHNDAVELCKQIGRDPEDAYVYDEVYHAVIFNF